MAVVGGAGAWQGPLPGVPLVMLVTDALRVGIEGVLYRVILGVLLMLIALLAPDGVVGLLRSARARLATPFRAQQAAETDKEVQCIGL